MYVMFYNAKFLDLVIFSDGKFITGLYIKNSKLFFQEMLEGKKENNNLEIFLKLRRLLDRYFNGEEVSFFEIPWKIYASEFRKLVYSILAKIPYGSVVSYEEIAIKVAMITGKKKCCQAVGTAIGHNPLSIIIPCHRVVGKNKSLVGYAAGIDIKRKLLEIEGIVISADKVLT